MGDGKDLSVNQKVVVWARAQVGKKIGRGQCWDLGEQALKGAGAQTSNDLGPVGSDTDYIWGDAKQIKDIEPGDILQIRNHVIKTTTKSTYVFADGSKVVDESEEEAIRPHHTAIVNSQPDAEGAVRTLEQHVRPLGDVVQNKKLYTRSLAPVTTKSSVRFKHPGTKKMAVKSDECWKIESGRHSEWSGRPAEGDREIAAPLGNGALRANMALGLSGWALIRASRGPAPGERRGGRAPRARCARGRARRGSRGAAAARTRRR